MQAVKVRKDAIAVASRAGVRLEPVLVISPNEHAYVARTEPDGCTIMIPLPSLAVIPEGNRLQGKPPATRWADVRRSDDPGGEEIVAVDIVAGFHRAVHLAMEMFLKAAQLRMILVPYQFGGPAFQRHGGPSRLRWRSRPDACAAEKLSLDDGHLLAGSDEKPRQRWPGLPSPNDDRIMMAHGETRVVIPQLWRDPALTRAGLRPRSGQNLPPTVPA